MVVKSMYAGGDFSATVTESDQFSSGAVYAVSFWMFPENLTKGTEQCLVEVIEGNAGDFVRFKVVLDDVAATPSIILECATIDSETVYGLSAENGDTDISGLENDRWYHVVYLVDTSNDEIELYIGEQGESFPYTTVTATYSVNCSDGMYGWGNDAAATDGTTDADVGVGSTSAGANFFEGCIQNLCVFSSLPSNATIQDYHTSATSETASLRHQWIFDDADTATVARDEVVSADLTYSGGTTGDSGNTTTPLPSEDEYAPQYAQDLVIKRASIPHARLSSTNIVAYTFWLWLDDYDHATFNEGFLFDVKEGGGGNVVRARARMNASGGITFTFRDPSTPWGANNYTVDVSSLTDGEPYHCIVYQSGSTVYFKAGAAGEEYPYTTLTDSSALSLSSGWHPWGDNRLGTDTATTADIAIGCAVDGTFELDGKIRDLCVWTSIPSDSDIQTANPGFYSTTTIPTGGVHNFRLNEDSGAFAIHDWWSGVTLDVTYDTTGDLGDVGPFHVVSGNGGLAIDMAFFDSDINFGIEITSPYTNTTTFYDPDVSYLVTQENLLAVDVTLFDADAGYGVLTTGPLEIDFTFYDPGTAEFYYLDCGGSGGTYDGNPYESDEYYTGGVTASNPIVDIVGTTNDDLYRYQRAGSDFTYTVPMPNGTYYFQFYGADIYSSGVGQNTFIVIINGSVEFGLDAYSAHGANTAFSYGKQIEVTDNEMVVRFLATIGNAFVSALSFTEAYDGLITISSPLDVDFELNGPDDVFNPTYINDGDATLPLSENPTFFSPDVREEDVVNLYGEEYPYAMPFASAPSAATPREQVVLDFTGDDPSLEVDVTLFDLQELDPGAAMAWLSFDAYEYRLKLTLDTTADDFVFGGSQTIPVRLKIEGSFALFVKTHNYTGQVGYIYDALVCEDSDTNVRPTEVTISEDDRLEIWTRLTLDSTSSTKTVYVYFGSQTANGDDQNSHQVWGDFWNVNHFDFAPEGTSKYRNSCTPGLNVLITETQGANYWAWPVAQYAQDQVTSTAGNAISLSGSNTSYVPYDDSRLGVTDLVSFQALVVVDNASLNGYPRIFDRSATSSANSDDIDFMLSTKPSETQDYSVWRFRLKTQNGPATGTYTLFDDDSEAVAEGSESWVTCTYDGVRMYIFANNSQIADVAASGLIVQTAGSKLHLGKSNATGIDYSFSGDISEFRVTRGVAVNFDRHRTEWQILSRPSEFIVSYDAIETYNPNEPWPITMDSGVQLDIDFAFPDSEDTVSVTEEDTVTFNSSPLSVDFTFMANAPNVSEPGTVPGHATLATSIVFDGFTWVFDKPYYVGYFIDGYGEPWVKTDDVTGNVKIVDILPTPSKKTWSSVQCYPSHLPSTPGYVKVTKVRQQEPEQSYWFFNGATIDIGVYHGSHGFDACMSFRTPVRYRHENNHGFPNGLDSTGTSLGGGTNPVSSSNPIVINPDTYYTLDGQGPYPGQAKVLMCSRSKNQDNPRATVNGFNMDQYCPLTVVNYFPGARDFRPNYSGKIKHFFSMDDMDLDKLPRLPWPSGYELPKAPWQTSGTSFASGLTKSDLDSFAQDKFYGPGRPVVRWGASIWKEYLAAKNHGGYTYGHLGANMYAKGLAWLLADINNQDKELLAAKMAQIAIDSMGNHYSYFNETDPSYHTVVSNFISPNNGGHGQIEFLSDLFGGYIFNRGDLFYLWNVGAGTLVPWTIGHHCDWIDVAGKYATDYISAYGGPSSEGNPRCVYDKAVESCGGDPGMTSDFDTTSWEILLRPSDIAQVPGNPCKVAVNNTKYKRVSDGKFPEWRNTQNLQHHPGWFASSICLGDSGIPESISDRPCSYRTTLTTLVAMDIFVKACNLAPIFPADYGSNTGWTNGEDNPVLAYTARYAGIWKELTEYGVTVYSGTPPGYYVHPDERSGILWRYYVEDGNLSNIITGDTNYISFPQAQAMLSVPIDVTYGDLIDVDEEDAVAMDDNLLVVDIDVTIDTISVDEQGFQNTTIDLEAEGQYPHAVSFAFYDISEISVVITAPGTLLEIDITLYDRNLDFDNMVVGPPDYLHMENESPLDIPIAFEVDGEGEPELIGVSSIQMDHLISIDEPLVDRSAIFSLNTVAEIFPLESVEINFEGQGQMNVTPISKFRPNRHLTIAELLKMIDQNLGRSPRA